ncbi:MAG: hypothetical protein HYV68_01340 [Candidatus Taylorbacteria bacterium]|nr:hypothetical protein [Candidatus Taylorbacteria bacterium]
MQTKVYIESKIWPLSLVTFVAIFLTLVYFFIDGIIASGALPFVVLTFVILYAIIYWHPRATVELSSEGFSFKKGKKSFFAEWGEVEGIFIVGSTSHNFFIRTKKGKTPVIDKFSLRLRGRKFFCNFVKDFEEISGKTLLFGDPIIKN